MKTPRGSLSHREERHRVFGSDLRGELKRLSKRAAVRRAAVAYVTSDEDVAFGLGDQLIVDASDAMIAGGQTSAKVLRRAFERGAEIFSLRALHAKLFLFDSDVAVIGSANLSGSGLVEAGIVTNDHAVAAAVASLINSMAEQAEEVDARFLDRISDIVVVRKPRAVHARKTVQRKTRRRGSRTWLVTVFPLKDGAFPDEQVSAEKGTMAAMKRRRNQRSDTSWIRYSDQSRFRREARDGDSVIQIWNERRTKRATVLWPVPIVYVQRTPRYSRIHVEDRPGRSLSWTAFARLLKKVNVDRVSKRSTRELSEEDARELLARWRAALS